MWTQGKGPSGTTGNWDGPAINLGKKTGQVQKGALGAETQLPQMVWGMQVKQGHKTTENLSQGEQTRAIEASGP